MRFSKFVWPPFVQPISGCYRESVVQLETRLSTWGIRKFNLSLISTYVIQIFDLDLANWIIAVSGHVTSKIILSGRNTQHSAQLVNLLWAFLVIVFQLCLSNFIFMSEDIWKELWRGSNSERWAYSGCFHPLNYQKYSVLPVIVNITIDFSQVMFLKTVF